MEMVLRPLASIYAYVLMTNHVHLLASAQRHAVGGTVQIEPGRYGNLLSALRPLHRVQSGEGSDGGGTRRISLVELPQPRFRRAGQAARRARTVFTARQHGRSAPERISRVVPHRAQFQGTDGNQKCRQLRMATPQRSVQGRDRAHLEMRRSSAQDGPPTQEPNHDAPRRTEKGLLPR